MARDDELERGERVDSEQRLAQRRVQPSAIDRLAVTGPRRRPPRDGVRLRPGLLGAQLGAQAGELPVDPFLLREEERVHDLREAGERLLALRSRAAFRAVDVVGGEPGRREPRDGDSEGDREADAAGAAGAAFVGADIGHDGSS